MYFIYKSLKSQFLTPLDSFLQLTFDWKLIISIYALLRSSQTMANIG